ncbi:MAG: hypothetical protein UT19_C0003G0067 [Candidatus Woesebacteria bacterium GW2011_GWB1_39_10b]|uniref:Uncharacterized protein n=2 Tax=Candidatus Woeseibacteriota TaxID=1752722 RepID=A0A0G0QV56_9BACT|nr:MAG: hypothetical protein US72_C0005G0065 [Microgenomates group bacterium GW2011_GWC1_38_12]KKQ94262.1 MAG: hypothetical protein UT19_C0003G0067 [Candidatus Woesebacteria bacterium GW2011_GWB1_39_10b]KKR14200.1 MAG: hypothetical protein UT40_C0004G0023 [Candidatus Woesebacteria bacterium GW2011_GWA1_39_21b]
MNEITEIPKIEPVPLRGKELERTLSQLSADRGLEPHIVERFLITDLEKTQGLSSADKWIPASMMAAHLVSLATVNYAGDTLPALGTLPPAIHELLQAVHNLTVNAANSPALRDHLPYLFLEGSVFYGAVKTVPNWLKLRDKKATAREQQTIVRQKTESGEMKFKMAQGHTAAFVGKGDWLADRLQEAKPDDQVMQYAQLKIDSGVWQIIQKLDRQEEVFETLDRGDFQSAGEVLILPVKDEDMFLPGDEGHDMSLDEIESLVSVLDAYCKSRNIESKRILIVGRKALKESYVTRTGDGEIETNSETLEERVKIMTQKRGETEIIDPTEIVMRRIMKLADGRKLTLAGTTASDERYGLRFFQALEEMGGYEPGTGEEIRVLYNITDIPTEMHVGDNDIAVILDPSKKQSLVNRGVPEENIIVVPDIVLDVLDKKVEE